MGVRAICLIDENIEPRDMCQLVAAWRAGKWGRDPKLGVGGYVAGRATACKVPGWVEWSPFLMCMSQNVV